MLKTYNIEDNIKMTRSEFVNKYEKSVGLFLFPGKYNKNKNDYEFIILATDSNDDDGLNRMKKLIKDKEKLLSDGYSTMLINTAIVEGDLLLQGVFK